MSVQILNQHQAYWNKPLSRFNFMITYRPHSQQGQSNALSRHSYLVPKEEDATYNQQHSVLLKPERLPLKTVKTTTSIDPVFLKDIHISLLSDLLALKFKQLCADFRPQNGQIKVLDSQTPDLEILDPESLDFHNSNSQIHRSQEGKRPQDDIDSKFQFMDGLLYYQGLFYIPDGPCRLQVL